MRQAADILSSAPAMQIRYLEAMQAMAKSANTKVIFLPGTSQNLDNAFNTMATSSPGATGESSGTVAGRNAASDFGGQDPGLQTAMNARIVENI